jgi:hypothetical protein
MRMMESRIRLCWPGVLTLVTCMILIALLMLNPLVRNHMPRYFMIFVFLTDTYCICFFLWMIRRLRRQSKRVELSNK